MSGTSIVVLMTFLFLFLAISACRSRFRSWPVL